MQWNDETLEGLSTSVKYTKCQLYCHMMKLKMIWWNEQWIVETLEGLSKSVKHTNCPSALAYDEINIHVKRVSNCEEKTC